MSSADAGRSLVLPNSSWRVEWARLETVQAGTVHWEMSADGGTHWQTIQPSGQWIHLMNPGTEPLWRASLVYDEPGLNPTVDELILEWTSDPTTSTRR